MLLFTQLTNPNVQTQMYANSRATTSRDYIHARDIAKQEQVQDIMQRALGNQLVSGIMFSHQENRYTHGLDHRSCSSYKQAEARKQKLAAWGSQGNDTTVGSRLEAWKNIMIQHMLQSLYRIISNKSLPNLQSSKGTPWKKKQMRWLLLKAPGKNITWNHPSTLNK
jgi:hypothetical protein